MLLLLAAQKRPLAIRLGQMRCRGFHHQHTALTIHDGPVIRRQIGNAISQLRHRGHPHAAGQNGRMAGGAVILGGKAEDHTAVQREQVAGEKLVRHQNAGLCEMQMPARTAVQNIHHPAAGIADVHAALPDIIVVHILQAARKNLLRPLHRRGTARTGGYVIANLVGEGFILQQRDLKGQNIRVLTAGVLL